MQPHKVDAQGATALNSTRPEGRYILLDSHSHLGISPAFTTSEDAECSPVSVFTETYGSPHCGFSHNSLYKQCSWLTDCGSRSSCGFITGAHPYLLSFIVVWWNDDDDSFHLASKLNFHLTFHVKCPCLHSGIFVTCDSASPVNTALIRVQHKREKKRSCLKIMPSRFGAASQYADVKMWNKPLMICTNMSLGSKQLESVSLHCVCGVPYLGRVFESSVVLVVAAVFLPTSSSETKESKLWGTPKTNMLSLI